MWNCSCIFSLCTGDCHVYVNLTAKRVNNSILRSLQDIFIASAFSSCVILRYVQCWQQFALHLSWINAMRKMLRPRAVLRRFFLAPGSDISKHQVGVAERQASNFMWVFLSYNLASSSSSSSSSSSLFAHKIPLKHARWDTREQDTQGTYCAPTEALNN